MKKILMNVVLGAAVMAVAIPAANAATPINFADMQYVGDSAVPPPAPQVFQLTICDRSGNCLTPSVVVTDEGGYVPDLIICSPKGCILPVVPREAHHMLQFQPAQ